MKVFHLLTLGMLAPETSLSAGDRECLVTASLQVYKTLSWLQKVHGTIDCVHSKIL